MFKHVQNTLPDVPVVDIGSEKMEELFSKSMSEGKQEILISEAAGQSFKPCPGTDESYICCNYWVLNQATNCPIDCSYCILQYYLSNPVLTLYSNLDKMKEEIRKGLDEEPHRFFRIGTGELADSLVMDPISDTAKELIDFAAVEKRFLLELKTKSDAVSHLVSHPHQGWTVMAWSLNPPFIIKTEEHKSATLSERLKAAALAEKAGYKLAFHFDPILYYPDWEKDYEETIKHLFQHINPESVTWISMGSLRYPPEMKSKAREKFPASPLFLGEMVLGKDNKMRYFKAIRLSMYKKIWYWLRLYGSKDLFIYFCMEDQEIWRETMGFAPENNAHLDFLFHESLRIRFPDLRLSPPNRDDYENFVTPRGR